MKKRILYLDVLKIFAIVLVCVYHFSWSNRLSYEYVLINHNYIEKAISSISLIAVPVFFMSNGAIILNRKLDIKKHYKGVLKSIFIMHSAWVLISLAYLCVFRGTSSITLKVIINIVLLGEVDGLSMASFWFMKEMIAMNIILPIIKHLYDEYLTKINTIAAFLMVFFVFILTNIATIQGNAQTIFPLLQKINLNNIGYLVAFLPRTLTMTIYFVIGGLLHKNRKNFIAKLNPFILFLSNLILLILVNYIGVILAKNGKNIDAVYSNYFTIFGFLFSVSFFILIERILGEYQHNNYLVTVFSDSTLVVYYLHWLVGLFVTSRIANKVSAFLQRDLTIYDDYLKAILLVSVITFLSVLVKKIKATILKLLSNIK